MAGDLNEVRLIGTVGQNPKIYQDDPAKKPFAYFSIATKQPWKDQTYTTWSNVKSWNPGDFSAIREGNRVEVLGQLRTDVYDKADGTKVRSTHVAITSIELLEGRAREELADSGSAGSNQDFGAGDSLDF